MAEITIPNFPDGLYDILERHAKAQHRSIESEVIARIQSTMDENPIDVEAWIEEANRNRQRIRGFLTDEMLRECRDEGRA
jgi:plasmid stability protein